MHLNKASCFPLSYMLNFDSINKHQSWSTENLVLLREVITKPTSCLITIIFTGNIHQMIMLKLLTEFSVLNLKDTSHLARSETKRY